MKKLGIHLLFGIGTGIILLFVYGLIRTFLPPDLAILVALLVGMLHAVVADSLDKKPATYVTVHIVDQDGIEHSQYYVSADTPHQTVYIGEERHYIDAASRYDRREINGWLNDTMPEHIKNR